MWAHQYRPGQRVYYCVPHCAFSSRRGAVVRTDHASPRSVPWLGKNCDQKKTTGGYSRLGGTVLHPFRGVNNARQPAAGQTVVPEVEVQILEIVRAFRPHDHLDRANLVRPGRSGAGRSAQIRRRRKCR